MKRALVVVGILLLAACKKEESGATSGAASGSAAPSAASSLTALTAPAESESAAVGDIAPTEDPDKLPPPAAAAPQAAKDISTTNYKTELDSIEKEMNSIK